MSKGATRAPPLPPWEAITLTYATAEAISGLSRSTLSAHVAHGNLRAKVVGGRTLIVASSLRDFLLNCPDAELTASGTRGKPRPSQGGGGRAQRRGGAGPGGAGP